MLSRTPGANQGSYAEQLEVEPITLCRMVDRLEEAQLVERRRDPGDRRAWQLHLTAKSRKIVERLQQEVDALLDGMLEGVSETERTDFVRILNVVGANLSACREAAREISKASNG